MDLHAIRRCPACQGGRPGFEVTAADVIAAPEPKPKATRNPPWTRDELILALDVYVDHPMAGENSPAVLELSTLPNRFWAATDLDLKTLRNPAGVSMKFGNFPGLDPTYLARGRKGLPHGGRGDEEVWNEFAGDRPRLRATVASLRAALEQAPDVDAAADTGQDAEAAEGTILTRLHHYRERDASLARKRKAQALAVTGRLVCEACDFDFAEAYGERGEGYIEVHHTKPLETLQPVRGRSSASWRSSAPTATASCMHRRLHPGQVAISREPPSAPSRPATDNAFEQLLYIKTVEILKGPRKSLCIGCGRRPQSEKAVGNFTGRPRWGWQMDRAGLLRLAGPSAAALASITPMKALGGGRGIS